VEVVGGTGGRVFEVVTGGSGGASVVMGGGRAALEVTGSTEEDADRVTEELAEKFPGFVTDVIREV